MAPSPPNPRAPPALSEPHLIRVAIDGTALGHGIGGDETYLRGLLAGLAAEAPASDSFPLLVQRGVTAPSEIDGDGRFPLLPLPRTGRVLRYGVTMGLVLGRHPRPDLVHCDVHAPLHSPSPIALLLPDLSFRHLPDCYPRTTRLRLEALVPLHLRQARVILTVSEFSRGDIIEQYRVDPDRVVVVSPGVRASAAMPEAEIQERLRRLLVRQPYFLYVGNLHPRKNVARLVRSFAGVKPRLGDHRLVIAGGRWWKGGEEEAAVGAAPAGAVQMLGRVDDRDRDALIRGALALVYPSLFEGFGLPPVEAMAVGTPVLASSTTSMPEVLDDAALLVDPTDEGAIGEALLALAKEEGLRTRLAGLGLRRAAFHSVSRMGRRALAAYHLAVSA